ATALPTPLADGTDADDERPVTVPVAVDLVVRSSTAPPDPAHPALSAGSPNER
ncbi:hypothetical protein N136_00143, partial [Leifsonia aquatica ATCC 14665]